MIWNLQHRSAIARRVAAGLMLGAMACSGARAQSFDVATIRPSGADVKFESNGKTTVTYGTLTMRDVTVRTCMQWAYGVPLPQISGPPSLRDVHYDITAKTSPDTTEQQMRLMMRTLLSERFKLSFHTEKKEMRAYTLTVAKGGIKMKPSAPGGEMFRQNSVMGMVAKSITMKELADFLADPLNTPLADGTGLPGRYDLAIDFTPYVDAGPAAVRPDMASVLKAALKGDLGLDLVQTKQLFDVMVVDHVEPPTAN